MAAGMNETNTLPFSGRVDGNQSLFTLDNTGFDASYTPLFFDNIDDLFGNNTMLKERAISLCGKKSFTCLFDVMLTGDTKAAAERKSTLEEFDAEQKILGTLHPIPIILSSMFARTETDFFVSELIILACISLRCSYISTKDIIAKKYRSLLW